MQKNTRNLNYSLLKVQNKNTRNGITKDLPVLPKEINQSAIDVN